MMTGTGNATAAPHAPACRRVLLTVEGGPHAGKADLARDLSRVLHGALAVDPSISETDKHGASPLALALEHTQAIFRAIARCPALPPTASSRPQILVCTSGTLDDALFVEKPIDAQALADAHRMYGARCGIEAHMIVALDLPLEEMHQHAIEAGEWPRCSIADLSDLPARITLAASRFGMGQHVLARTVATPPHFNDCEVDRAEVLAAAAHGVECMLRRLGLMAAYLPVPPPEPEPNAHTGRGDAFSAF